MRSTSRKKYVPFRPRAALVVLLLLLGYGAAFFPLYRFVGREVSVLSTVPVLLAGWRFGRGWGIAAAVAAAVLVPLLEVLAGGRPDPGFALVGSGVLLVVGATAGRVRDLRDRERGRTEELRRAKEALQHAHDELEGRVEERTAELRAVNESLRREIAERTRVEEALRQSEQDYHGLFTNAHDAILLLDPEDECVLDANPRACELYGYGREELLRLSIRSISQDPERGDRQIRQTLEKGTRYRFETVQYRRDGSEMHLEINASAVEYRGRCAILSINRDITDRKRAEEALRESEERFRTVVETLGEGLLITDLEDVILYASPRVREIFGYAPEELVGRVGYEIVLPEEEREAFAGRMARRQVGISERYEMRYLRRDGTRRWLEVYAAPFRDGSGRIVGTLGAVTDITERKEAEQALRDSQQQLVEAQKMEAVGRLAGGIAHDFNNMLTAIRGFAQLLLLESPDGDPGRLYMEEIVRAADRSADLTRQLLAFSRRQVLQPRVLDLNSVVGETDRMLRRVIGEDIDLVTLLEPTLGRVRADPGQLGQVLVNLAVNARDAMPYGGKLMVETCEVEVGEEEMRRRPYLRPGAYVALVVRDTGVGMDAATQERVFEPFFTTKPQGKGTGLGLSTVYGIVKQSGGFVWVESEPGQGAIFRILLPRVAAAADRLHRDADGGEMPAGAETVLLVEDEPAVRHLARRVLQRSGYRVLEAGSGAEAIRLFQEHAGEIHLLLTDVVMPRMGGAELAESLLPLAPELRVLYMSGYTDDAIVHHGVLDPGTEFLQKPFSPDALARKVRQVLDR